MFPNCKQPKGPPTIEGTVGYTQNTRSPSSGGATAQSSTDDRMEPELEQGCVIPRPAALTCV